MPEPRSSVRECRSSLQEELKAYLDGELPPLRRAAMERHLGTCPACQAELASLRQLSVQLSEALPSVAPLPDALRARILRSLPDASGPRPVLFPFWRRPGPLAALGGALAMGCAFWLWVRVPESGKPMASSSSSATRAPLANEANIAAAPSAKYADNARASSLETVESGVPSPASVTLRANKNEAEKAPALAPVHENASSLKASLPVSVSPEDSKGVASAAKRVRLSSPPAPSPVLSDGDPEGAGKKDKDISGSPKTEFATRAVVTGRGAALPSVYTLTVAPGKRPETLEAIRKLAGELSVTLASEQPELDLRLALDGREALLDRLKALGKLAEGERPPSAPEKPRFGGNGNSEGAAAPGAGGFGGGGGGAALKSQPQLKLIVIIKELKPKELP